MCDPEYDNFWLKESDLIPYKAFYYIRPLYSWISNHPQISNTHNFTFYADITSMTKSTNICYVMI